MLSVKGLAVVGLVAITFLYSIVKRWIVYQRLRQYKGPPLAAWTHLWYFKQIWIRGSCYAQVDTLRKYGSPARIQPNVLVTDDPDLWRHMSAPRSGWTRGDWYKATRFSADSDTVFSATNEKFHNEVKSMEIGAYNMRDVDTVEDDVDEVVQKLVRLLRTRYHDRQCDLADISSWFALDSLSQVAYAESFGFLDADEDLWDYNLINRQMAKVLETIVSIPMVRNLFLTKFIHKRLLPRTTDPKGPGVLNKFAQDRVTARYTGKADSTRRDFLAHFIRKGVSQDQALAECVIQIIAGSESTASTIRNTLTLIVSNPAVYARLRQEIDDAVADGKLSSPVVKNTEAQKLDYLQACIWEGLRMFPPLQGMSSKKSPGDTFKGNYYPPGTEVAHCFLGVCRRQDIFGSDVDIYRPERFLNADEETRTKMMRTADLVFGSGRYGCLGRTIALLELNKVFVEIMRHFDWSLANPFLGSSFVAAQVWIQADMNFYVRQRQV